MARGTRLPVPMLAVLLSTALRAQEPSVVDVRLEVLPSARYEVHTNASREEVRPYVRHMEGVHAEYSRRFAGLGGDRSSAKLPLYLFRTAEDYSRYLRAAHLDPTNTAGVYFRAGGTRGLATYLEGNSPSRIRAVLQHEGLHQFVDSCLDGQLPPWANEGLAEYFGKGLVVRGSLQLGLVDGRNLALVRNAFGAGEAVPLAELFALDGAAWNEAVATDLERARLHYAEAWSIVHFLVHADGERHRERLEVYLRLMARGNEADRSFSRAFGSDLAALEADWREYVLDLAPDAITVTLERIEFLERGVRALADSGRRTPSSLDELRDALIEIGFGYRVVVDRLSTDYLATDPSLYRYLGASGAEHPFEVVSSGRNLPPKILARRLGKTTLALEWGRQADGSLVSRVEFR